MDEYVNIYLPQDFGLGEFTAGDHLGATVPVQSVVANLLSMHLLPLRALLFGWYSRPNLVSVAGCCCGCPVCHYHFPRQFSGALMSHSWPQMLVC